MVINALSRRQTLTISLISCQCIKYNGLCHLQTWIYFVISGETTLRRFSSSIGTTQGFQSHVIEELTKEAALLPENERFVVLMHDEIKIQEDLVYDFKGNLIGFVCDEELDHSKVKF